MFEDAALVEEVHAVADRVGPLRGDRELLKVDVEVLRTMLNGCARVGTDPLDGTNRVAHLGSHGERNS